MLAYVVAKLVIRIFLNVGVRHLGYVAKHVGGVGSGVLADAAPLHVKAWETVYFFLENAEFLFGKLAHEHLLGVRGITGIFIPVFYLGHSFFKVFLCYAERFAEVERVEASFFLVHHHHYVISVLVVNKQFAVPVGYCAARRELNPLQESVAVGVLLVVVAHYLEGEKAYDVDHDDEYGDSADYILSVFKSVILIHNQPNCP